MANEDERDAVGAAPSWTELLSSARATPQVIALANEYLARLTPGEVIILPSECKPRALASAIDVNAYAVDLKMSQPKDLREAELLARISAFFQAACQRLAGVTGPHRALPPALWEKWNPNKG